MRPAERRRLDEHLASCSTCAAAAVGMRRDAAQFASIPVVALSDRRQAALLRAALRPPASHPLRLVAIAALIALLATGSFVVGAQLLRQTDDELSHGAYPRPARPGRRPAPSRARRSPQRARRLRLPATVPPAPSETEAPPPVAVLKTPEPNADSVPIAPDSIGVVVTNDLRVRSQPEVSDTSERLTPLLQDGQQVLIVDGPVSGSGYEWYLVAPFGGFEANGAAVRLGRGRRQERRSLARHRRAWTALPCRTPSPRSSPWRIESSGPACRSPASATVRSRSRPGSCGRRRRAAWTWAGRSNPSGSAATCRHPEFLFLDQSGSMDEYRNAVIAPGVDTSGFDPGVVPARALTWC